MERTAPVPSWKAKAERGSAWLIHLIAWLARAAGRPCCRALLYPIVLYFVLTDATARRASREFFAAVQAGRRLERRLRARPLLRRHLARPRLHGERPVRSLRGRGRGRCARRRSAPGRQGLRPARLAPRQLRPDVAEEQGAARPAGHDPDALRRSLARAPHRRRRRRQAFDHPARPLRQLPARLRRARQGRHRRRARRSHRERVLAAQHVLRPAAPIFRSGRTRSRHAPAPGC